jgi:phosphatidylglycerol---prolipoprotein diacylglyceryl transferase
VLSGIYLIVNGLERFMVEKIRVNAEYSLFGFQPSQAQVIALLLVIGGVILIILQKRKTAAKSSF